MLHILLCEDEDKYIESFVLEFGGYYGTDDKYTKIFKCNGFQVEVCRDLNHLDRRLRNEKLPDVLVLDLYWPLKHGQDRSAFDKAVQLFNDTVDSLKQEVPRYLFERGYYFCQEEIRKNMKISKGDLPILLYTKAGQYVLDPHQRRDLAKDNIEFLLKRDDPDTKKALIRRCVEKWRYQNDVFVSHASVDNKITQEIVSYLKNYELRVFFSPQIRAGDEFNNTLRDMIASSKLVTVILSRGALESKWVMWEIGAS